MSTRRDRLVARAVENLLTGHFRAAVLQALSPLPSHAAVEQAIAAELYAFGIENDADMIPRAKVRELIVQAGADLAAMLEKAGALSRDWDMDQWRVEAEIIADRLLAEHAQQAEKEKE